MRRRSSATPSAGWRRKGQDNQPRVGRESAHFKMGVGLEPLDCGYPFAAIESPVGASRVAPSEP